LAKTRGVYGNDRGACNTNLYRNSRLYVTGGDGAIDVLNVAQTARLARIARVYEAQ
jgi:hypothetical protein